MLAWRFNLFFLKLLLLEIIAESVFLRISMLAVEEGENDISFKQSNSLLAASSFTVYC